MLEIKECCGNCKYWVYNQYTEDTYGMGVGKCTLSGDEVFCEHSGSFCFAYSPSSDFERSIAS